jgi:ATP-binding cassette subfamily B protein
LDLLDTVPEVKDSPEVAEIVERRRREQPEDGLAEDGYPDRIGTVEFRNVSFAYQGGKPVLKNFSMTVPAGTTVALVGPTGGGKSTIVSLLCRFYEPTEGEILIDGIDYRKRSLHWLQSNLGIVLQTPHLFSGTVKENIRYARLDASDEEIERAARIVNAHPFISELENGYETHVGQAGNKLSTGQKQLISFSRAVLADPQIFVMDEATSSIDTETERRIQRGVEAVLSGRMSFVIAHRLSTIRHSDEILVIEEGGILERGNHHDLLTQRGKYYELYTRQFVEEAETHVLAGKQE